MIQRVLALLLLCAVPAWAQSGAPSVTSGSAAPQSGSFTTGDCNEPTRDFCEICVKLVNPATDAVVWQNFSGTICSKTSTFSRQFVEGSAYGITFGLIDGADLEISQQCITVVAGETCGNNLSTQVGAASSAVTMATSPRLKSTASTTLMHGRTLKEDRFSRPNTSNTTNAVDPDGTLWSCTPSGASQYLRILDGALNSSGWTSSFCTTVQVLPADQWIQARVSSTDASTSNQDFFLQLRKNGTGDLSYYGCKLEGGNVHFQKLYDVDADGTLDVGEYSGACGLTASPNVPTGGAAKWLRCEVYTSPTDSAQVILKGYTAPDSSGLPGTWTLVTTVQDGTTDTCAGWNFAGANTGAGRLAVSVAKTGVHNYDVIQWGVLTNQGGRIHPSRRAP